MMVGYHCLPSGKDVPPSNGIIIPVRGCITIVRGLISSLVNNAISDLTIFGYFFTYHHVKMQSSTCSTILLGQHKSI